MTHELKLTEYDHEKQISAKNTLALFDSSDFAPLDGYKKTTRECLV